LFGFSVFDFNSEARNESGNEENRKVGRNQEMEARSWEMEDGRWDMASHLPGFMVGKTPCMSPVAVSGLRI
jgi:hypothetical protein